MLVDRLDVKIWRELIHGEPYFSLNTRIRRPFRSVAEKLGVDEDTVRNRINRLRESGFLKGWICLVNPNLLGFEVVQLWFDYPQTRSREQLVEGFKLVPGVMTIMSCFNNAMILYLTYDSHESLTRLVQLITKISDAGNLVYDKLTMPDCNIQLSATDYRILRAIFKDPRKPYGKIARDIGLSVRTVRRRLERMISGRAVFLLPSLDPTKLEGAFMTSLVVFHDSAKSKAQIDAKILSYLDEYLALVELGHFNHSWFVLMVSNLWKLQEIISWTKRLEPVRKYRIDIILDRIELFDFIDQYLKKFQDAVMRGKIPIKGN